MAGRISAQIIEQVRHANDVVDVIGAYFPLKKAGVNYRALCPFHKEKTPSFNVNPSKQMWKCFGCGAGGDVFKFVMQYENLDFIDAVRRLAEKAGIKIEVEDAGATQHRGEKELLLKLHEEVSAYFQENLKAGIAQRYLEKREISREVARKWRIGYSTESWDGLLQWAAGKKYQPELLEAAGLAIRTEEGRVYDRFRGRLMFSICDEQGRVIGFSGRILTDDKDQPKYVNSPETAIFQKGRVLFALDRAKRSIIEEKFAILCEGQIDTIACHEAGLTNVVAPQGTALTDQHARILRRYAEEVVLMYDADEAGQKAIIRSAEPLWEAGMAMRVAVIPGKDDPDSFIKTQGAEKLKELITNGGSFFIYLLEWLTKHHDPNTERGKLQIARQMAEWLVRLPSPVLVAKYAQETTLRLQIAGTSIEQEVLKLRQQRSPRPVVEPVPAVPEDLAEIELEPNQPAETLLLQLMLTDVRIVDLALERLESEWLTRSVAAQLIERVLQLHRDGHWDGPNTLMNEADDDDASKLAAELVVKPAPSQNLDAAATDCLGAMERVWVERRLRELRNQLSHTDLNSEQRDKILREVLDLQPKLRNIPALSMRKR
ncbi:MAG: DNA primase [Verrucomicrobiae bacterium]|nr:DNA primase [Verrucomicrobiae bacterium]